MIVDVDRDRDDTVGQDADRDATIDAESFDVMWIFGLQPIAEGVGIEPGRWRGSFR